MRLRGIEKSYEDKQVITDFSYEFHEGIYAVMGESGCGKTTLLRIIAGLEMPDDGEISDREPQLKMMFQENRLVEGFGAVKNIKLANPKLEDTRIEKELYTLGFTKQDLYQEIEASRSKFQIGFMGKTRKRVIPVSDFSGGMKRRVCFLQALLSDAKLVLLDEPFTGLDMKITKEALDFLISKKEGRCIIFTTHDESKAKYLGAKIISLS